VAVGLAQEVNKEHIQFTLINTFLLAGLQEVKMASSDSCEEHVLAAFTAAMGASSPLTPALQNLIKAAAVSSRGFLIEAAAGCLLGIDDCGSLGRMASGRLAHQNVAYSLSSTTLGRAIDSAIV
jgi:hypothetical protein